MPTRADEPASLSPRQLIEAMKDGVIVTDLRGRILAVNRAFSRVTGYSRREAVGNNPRMLHSGRHGKAFYRAMWASILRSGGWSGDIWNRRKNGRLYVERLTVSTIRGAEGRPLRYLGVFSDVTRSRAAEERLLRQGRYDPLTGLPNRRALEESARAALARRDPKRRLAALFLDLDGFKRVNDEHGHAVGDLLLRAETARLSSCVRRTDVASRWGGDEFVVLLDSAADRRGVARVAAKILRVLSRPFLIHGRRLRVGASVGASLLGSKGSAARWLREADAAMYRAKRRGGGRLEFSRSGPG